MDEDGLSLEEFLGAGFEFVEDGLDFGFWEVEVSLKEVCGEEFAFPAIDVFGEGGLEEVGIALVREACGAEDMEVCDGLEDFEVEGFPLSEGGGLEGCEQVGLSEVLHDNPVLCIRLSEEGRDANAGIGEGLCEGGIGIVLGAQGAMGREDGGGAVVLEAVEGAIGAAGFEGFDGDLLGVPLQGREGGEESGLGDILRVDEEGILARDGEARMRACDAVVEVDFFGEASAGSEDAIGAGCGGVWGWESIGLGADVVSLIEGWGIPFATGEALGMEAADVAMEGEVGVWGSAIGPKGLWHKEALYAFSCNESHAVGVDAAGGDLGREVVVDSSGDKMDAAEGGRAWGPCSCGGEVSNEAIVCEFDGARACIGGHPKGGKGTRLEVALCEGASIHRGNNVGIENPEGFLVAEEVAQRKECAACAKDFGFA